MFTYIYVEIDQVKQMIKDINWNGSKISASNYYNKLWEMTNEFENIKDHQHQLGDYIISIDKSLLDIKIVHAFLSKSS